MQDSHIFCVTCANTLGLSSPSTSGIRVCPACETQLSNPDDAVETHLNPSEDYKTSVLSGLHPSLIMECASRGVAFFQYQTTQEIQYQEYMAKGLTDRYATLSTQMDNVINEANAEVLALREKMSSLHNEKRSLEQKNQELANAFREKSRAQQRLQTLCQRLKSQQNALHMEKAAATDADDVVDSITGGPQYVDDFYHRAGPHRQSAAHGPGVGLPPVFSHGRIGSAGSAGSGKRRMWPNQSAAQGDGGGLHYHPRGQGRTVPPGSVYTSRTPLRMDQENMYPDSIIAARQNTATRRPLGEVSQNVQGARGMNGYGLSGSAKRDGTTSNGRFSNVMGRTTSHVLHR